jgi:hypothetical protein
VSKLPAERQPTAGDVGLHAGERAGERAAPQARSAFVDCGTQLEKRLQPRHDLVARLPRQAVQRERLFCAPGRARVGIAQAQGRTDLAQPFAQASVGDGFARRGTA